MSNPLDLKMDAGTRSISMLIPIFNHSENVIYENGCYKLNFESAEKMFEYERLYMEVKNKIADIKPVALCQSTESWSCPMFVSPFARVNLVWEWNSPYGMLTRRNGPIIVSPFARVNLVWEWNSPYRMLTRRNGPIIPPLRFKGSLLIVREIVNLQGRLYLLPHGSLCDDIYIMPSGLIYGLSQLLRNHFVLMDVHYLVDNFSLMRFMQVLVIQTLLDL
eukprot:scaffold11636_cov62-Cyclotella_meneghiniana.AAC.13